jgi:putative sigma-54 modulation protein
MRIDIHSSKFELTESLRDYIERRVQFAFNWAYDKLPQVHFRLNDVNGPKGGVDKVCRIQIPIAGANPVVVEEIQADMYVAIDRAVERASRTMSRRIQRTRTHRREQYQAVAWPEAQ